MLPKLKISIYLLKRLERIKQQSSGCLFGVFYGEGTLLLMGFNLESTIGKLNYEQIQYKFPAEIDLCGLVKFGDCSDAEAHLNDILKDVDITDNPILLQCELGTLVGLRASIFMHGKLQKIPYHVVEEEELYHDFCFTRLRCNLSFFTDQTIHDLRCQMHDLRKIMSGGTVVFRIEPTKIYVTNTGITNHASDYIADILHSVSLALFETCTIQDEESLYRDLNKRRKKIDLDNILHLSNVYGVYGSDYDVINIEVLRRRTQESIYDSEINSNKTKINHLDNNIASDMHSITNTVGVFKQTSLPLPAVSICVQRNETKALVPLEVEAIAMLFKHTKSNRLYDILIESICRALRLYEYSVVKHFQDTEAIEESKKLQMLVPRGYHFLPLDFGHFLTCAYIAGIPDDDERMLEKRKRLHRHFGLPVTRPYFRRANRCLFRNEVSKTMPLMNTHIGVRSSGVLNGIQYLVKGNYYYYHYSQQQIQDKGWGCAYRSLQTLYSWFLLQGYTERTVPSHKEIQEYLVLIGDKPLSFIGSSQWIGSTEVSMCLQGFINVYSKIRHITSGADLNSLGPELVQHFQVDGTPIMIGGGVLAHTIIGVDYCAQSEQIKFLILDPHYSGSDDVHKIHSRGWCGWKDVNFWDKKSYYNLCMPQTPISF